MADPNGLGQAVLDAVASAGVKVSFESAVTLLEGGVYANNGESYWVLDPIDGTKGFLRGGQFAIALALIQEGVVTLAPFVVLL